MSAVAQTTSLKAETASTGTERAAQLLLLLGEDSAARILQELDHGAIQKLGTAMSKLRVVDSDHAHSALEDFLQQYKTDPPLALGGSDYTRRVLIQALGEEQAVSVLSNMSLGANTGALESLQSMEPHLVAAIIGEEHPQIQAIVMSYLPSASAAAVLSEMPEANRLEIMERMASTESVDPQALDELNESLRAQVEGMVAKQQASTEGIRLVANILNTMKPDAGEKIIAGLQEFNSDLAQQVRDQLYVFEDLLKIADREFQSILREAQTDRLTLAMKGADDELKDKVFRNMSTRAAEIFKEDMEEMGPVKLSDVEAAQKEILDVVKRLMEAGDISAPADGSELVE